MPFNPNKPAQKYIHVDVDGGPYTFVPDDPNYQPLILNGVEIPRVAAYNLRRLPKTEFQKWLANREACLRDQLVLSRVMGLDLVENPHRVMFDFFGRIEKGMTIQDFATKTTKKKMCLLPRGIGKTFGIRVQAVYAILNFPRIRICFLTGGENLGKRQSVQTKKVFSRPTPEFLRLFPEFCLVSELKKGQWTDESPDWGNAHEWSVPARGDSIFPEPTFAISTAKAAKAGSHFTLIIIDDLVNDTNWDSEPALEQSYQDYLDICPLLDPLSGSMLVTGTRYAVGDTYDRIQAKAQEMAAAGQDVLWAFLIRGCWSSDCQNPNCKHPALFHSNLGLLAPCTKPGCLCSGFVEGGEKTCLFPAVPKENGELFGHTKQFLLGALNEYGKRYFSCQYLNEPEVAIQFKTFTQDLIDSSTIELSAMPGRGDSLQYLCGDMAYALGEDCDDSVIFAFAKPRLGGAHYIWGCWWGKFGAADKADLVLNTIKLIRPETMFIQKDLGSENFLLNLTARATMPQFLLNRVPITFTESGSNQKDAKLKRIADSELAMRGKRLYFAVSVINGVTEFQGTPGAYAKLCQQLLKFPSPNSHDDFADCAAQVAAATQTGYLHEVLPSTKPQMTWLQKLNAPAEPEHNEPWNDGSLFCMVMAVEPVSRSHKAQLTQVNYALHEASHAAASVYRKLPTSVDIRPMTVACGNASGMTWSVGGTVADDLFVLSAGLAGSKYFHLGEAGCLQDRHDITSYGRDETTLRSIQAEADIFVAAHVDMILKLAYVLSWTGGLTEEQTKDIWSGKKPVIVPKSFLDAVHKMRAFDWVLKS